MGTALCSARGLAGCAIGVWVVYKVVSNIYHWWRVDRSLRDHKDDQVSSSSEAIPRRGSRTGQTVPSRKGDKSCHDLKPEDRVKSEQCQSRGRERLKPRRQSSSGKSNQASLRSGKSGQPSKPRSETAGRPGATKSKENSSSVKKWAPWILVACGLTAIYTYSCGWWTNSDSTPMVSYLTDDTESTANWLPSIPTWVYCTMGALGLGSGLWCCYADSADDTQTTIPIIAPAVRKAKKAVRRMKKATGLSSGIIILICILLLVALCAVLYQYCRTGGKQRLDLVFPSKKSWWSRMCSNTTRGTGKGSNAWTELRLDGELFVSILVIL